ncbi:MAG: hypothetical protein JNG84_13970 [Archangium sp.]|nr:hypothetical protein [Archangium sp.]
MLYRIEYFTNAAAENFPTVLVVNDSGLVELRVHTNDDDRTQGIGLYSTTLSNAQLARFLSLVTSRSFLGEFDAAPAELGDVVRRFTITHGTAGPIVRSARKTNDAMFSEAETLAMQLVEQARKHPQLAARLTFEQPQDLTERVPTFIGLTLTNIGTERFWVPQKERWQQDQVDFSVFFRRRDVATGTTARTDVSSLSRKELTKVTPVANSDSQTDPLAATVAEAGLGLKPTDGVTFIFYKQLKLEAGPYELWGSVVLSLLDKHSQPRFAGELVSAPVFATCVDNFDM